MSVSRGAGGRARSCLGHVCVSWLAYSSNTEPCARSLLHTVWDATCTISAREGSWRAAPTACLGDIPRTEGPLNAACMCKVSMPFSTLVTSRSHSGLPTCAGTLSRPQDCERLNRHWEQPTPFPPERSSESWGWHV